MKKTWLMIIALMIWIMLVLVGYYAIHKPISRIAVMGMLRAAGQLTLALLGLSVAGGLGSWIFRGRAFRESEAVILQAALGLGLLAAVLLIWGFSVGLQTWELTLLTGVLLVSLRKFILKWWRRIWKDVTSWKKMSRQDWILAVLIILILALNFFRALTPPLKFDALVYHLALPRRYLQAGQMLVLPGHFFWGMPQNLEMFFTWAMGLGGEGAAQLLGWSIGGLALYAVYRAFRVLGGLSGGLVAVLVLLSGYSTAQSLSWAYGNWLNILYGSAFIIAIMARGDKSPDGEETDPANWVWGRAPTWFLPGALAGLALGVKYTSGALLVSGLVLILWSQRSRGQTSVFRAWLVFGGAAILFLSPWLIKNLLGTGNPLHPFFSSDVVQQQRMKFYKLGGQSVPWWNIIGLPVTFSILGVEGGPGFAGSLGPLFLALAPWSLLRRKRESKRFSKSLNQLLVITAVGFLTWGIGALYSTYLLQSRLYSVLFPVWAVLAGVGYEKLGWLKAHTFKIQRVVIGLVILVVSLTAYRLSSENTADKVPASIYHQQEDQHYLEANLGWYGAAVREIGQLPEGSRVLMLWEPREYYCLPDCRGDEVLDRWYLAWAQKGTGKEVIADWAKEGYTHLLYYQTGAEFIKTQRNQIPAGSWVELESTLEEMEMVKNLDGVYFLYRTVPR